LEKALGRPPRFVTEYEHLKVEGSEFGKIAEEVEEAFEIWDV